MSNKTYINALCTNLWWFNMNIKFMMYYTHITDVIKHRQSDGRLKWQAIWWKINIKTRQSWKEHRLCFWQSSLDAWSKPDLQRMKLYRKVCFLMTINMKPITKNKNKEEHFSKKDSISFWIMYLFLLFYINLESFSDWVLSRVFGIMNLELNIF